MNPTDLVDQANLRTDLPDFSPGDTVKVHVRVVEGAKERIQVFQGVVIRRQGSGVRETFTARKVTFPLTLPADNNSPSVTAETEMLPETLLAAASRGVSAVVTLPLIVSTRIEPRTPVTLTFPEVE